MRAHVIENGKVVNTIVVDSLDVFPNLVDAELGGGIGWSYVDGTFSPPVAAEVTPSVPQVVTLRQARLALLQAGKLADVAPAIASLPSPQREAAEIEWEYAQEVRRDWPLLLQLIPVLGLTNSEVDQLFTVAATL